MHFIVKTIELIEEIRPAIFEVTFSLHEGGPIQLVMNEQTLRTLMAQIVAHTIA
jgi:hypothetical protein